jgi:hypothetical protein
MRIGGGATLALGTLREAFRGPSPWVFLAIGAIAALTGILAPSIGSADERALLLLSVSMVVLFVLGGTTLVFVSALAVPRDLEEGSVLTVLSKPVPRSVYAVGRGLGLFVAGGTLGLLACFSAYVTLKLVAPSFVDADGMVKEILGESQAARPTRLIPGTGPTPEGRVYFLTDFPPGIRWVASMADPEDDSFVKFTFRAEDVLRCQKGGGWLGLEMSALNNTLVPMTQITPATVRFKVIGQRTDAPEAWVLFQEQAARTDLPPELSRDLKPGVTVEVEVRPDGQGMFLQADRGSAHLALPAASSFGVNFLLLGLGTSLGLAVVTLWTFVASILFSAKTAILVGLAAAGLGVARENVRALLRLLGQEGMVNPETLDPLKILEDYLTHQDAPGGFAARAGSVVDAVVSAMPDLSRFDFIQPFAEGICVSLPRLGGAFLYAGACALALFSAAIVLMQIRRLR